MKKTGYIFLLGVALVQLSFTLVKSRTALISQKWSMVSMEINGTKVSEAMMERQRRQGMLSVIQFNKNGTMYIYIKSPKMVVSNKATGKTKKNKWKFTEGETKLVITSEQSKEESTFDILKLSKKKMILRLKDKANGEQTFIYKAFKTKKK